MSRIIITGGNKLEGKIRASGAKNAALPILAATILNGGTNVINNCPDIQDVSTMIMILEYLGCKVERKKNTVIVNSSNINKYYIPDELMRKMRSSFIFLGSIISRCRKALLSYPGGCAIGPRPIDLHLKSLKYLGISIKEGHGYISCKGDKITGNDIHLNFPSVGATENIMLASVMCKGTTIIRNAAKEPEIVDLQNYINAMGGKIRGAGSSVIVIDGVSHFHDNVEYTVISDRIEASTYLIAAAITGGIIEITDVIPEHLQAILSILKESGCKIYTNKRSIILSRNEFIKPIDFICTLPYPGFPTDIQAPMMSLLTLAKGTSIISETIFENRFKHVEELLRMGANVKLDGRVAVIKGTDKLSGAAVKAMDLRGGAALIVAGLAADGKTIIEGVNHIDRGYEKIEKKLASLNARIKRVD